MNLHVTVNKQFEFDIEPSISGSSGFKLDAEVIDWDLIKLSENWFNIIYKGTSYTAEVLELDEKGKSISIKINGFMYQMAITDSYDALLKSLGMNQGIDKKPANLKAPMPGLVIRVLVSPEQKILKGMPLLVLEAMKMENIIHATDDVVLQSVEIKPGDKVEKGQVLLKFNEQE